MNAENSTPIQDILKSKLINYQKFKVKDKLLNEIKVNYQNLQQISELFMKVKKYCHFRSTSTIDFSQRKKTNELRSMRFGKKK